METILETALALAAAGFSVVPIAANGSKHPPFDWKEYQHEPAGDDKLRQWFGHHFGLGLVCGYYQLEVIDFDKPELFRPWLEQVRKWLGEEFVKRLVIVRTPSGGYHVYYRCAEIERNQRLAQEPGDDGRPLVMIETRGEGGLVVTPFSPPACHPSGKPYQLKQGSLLDIPTILPGERKLLLDAARQFDRLAKAKTVRKPTPGTSNSTPGNRPGDDYNRRGDGHELLVRNGWKLAESKGNEGFYRRPGKDTQGHCISYNYKDSNLIFAFCSNAVPFELDRSCTLFEALALLEHGGDFSAAARALAREGYGTPAVQKQQVATQAITVSAVAKLTGTYRLTEGGNAQRLLNAHGENYRFSKPTGPLFWNGRYWQPEDGELAEDCKHVIEVLYDQADAAQAKVEELEAACEADPKLSLEPLKKAREQAKALMRHALRSDRAAGIRGMIEMAQTDPRVHIAVDDLDAAPMLFNCANGTLELRTGRLREHRREDLITRMAPVSYDPAAACPRFLAFLDRIFQGDQDLISFLQKVVGYCLTGDTREQALFVLHGTGENGKSTLVDVLMRLLGSYSQQTPPATLLARRSNEATNDLARLKGARFVSAVETEDGQRLAENMVKRITGQDPVTARFLYREHFTFLPSFKLFLATNHKPTIRGTDHAIWRRIRLIPFGVRITEAERDRTLGDKLREELSGILNWALAGCLAWQREGLDLPPAVQAATTEYRREMDMLAHFLAESCLQQPGARARSVELYTAYKQWCEQSGEHAESQRHFTRRLIERGLAPPERGAGGNLWWQGIGLLEKPAGVPPQPVPGNGNGHGPPAAEMEVEIG